MKFNFKQTAGVNFLVGLIVASFIWFLFGWALTAFQFAPVFKSINYYGLAAWFTSDLPFKAPLVLFWYILLVILAVLWLICLSARTIVLLKSPAKQPVKRGVLCAIYVITALLLIFQAADICTSTRINNIPILNGGKATFNGGLEITLEELDYTNGLNYLNLPLNTEPYSIKRSDWDLTANTAVIGIKPANSGINYQESSLLKPFQYEGINIVIEKFVSHDSTLEPAGVWVSMTKKPLMYFVIALYILLAVGILALMIAPRFDKQPVVAESTPKLPPKTMGSGTAMAKKKKKH